MDNARVLVSRKPPEVSKHSEEKPKSRIEIAIEELIVLRAELSQLEQTETLSLAVERIESAEMWLRSAMAAIQSN